jgi:tRNA1Val (adenine37-N6)-methyltransferase
MSDFQFQQFSIRQTHAALKVGTDALLIGSIAHFTNPKSILDIGTGTGVLAMMCAQRFPEATIEAVELDEQACIDAVHNFTSSPFADRLCLIQSDIKHFQSDKQFDGIICNPPYFENSQLSADKSRSRARHTHDLDFDSLIAIISSILSPSGKAWIILPENSNEKWLDLVNQSPFQLSEKWLIYGKPDKLVRNIYCLQHEATRTQIHSLTVRQTDGTYTPEYIALTRDFHDRDLSKS